jgi:FkbM family methyltransferase
VPLVPYSRLDAKLHWAGARMDGDPTLAIIDALVHDRDVVVDAGADWGIYALRLAELVGLPGRVHAFEPNPLSHERLTTVVELDPQVRVHAAALSDRAGTATLHVPVDAGEAIGPLGSLRALGDVPCETVEVATVTLDDALGGDAERVSFVKVDVEGHELAVLHGAERLLASARPALLVEIEHRHAGDRMGATFDYLASLGYAASAVTARGLLPFAEFDLERDQLAHLDGGLQGDVPREYVHDFLFLPADQPTPSSLSDLAVAARTTSQE